MILIPHLVVSGVIAAKINFLPLALVLAFLSHYLLDFVPHVEYSIDNIENKNWKKSGKDFLKLGIDFLAGLIFLIIIRQISAADYYVLAAAGFMGILPDIITAAYFFYPNKKFAIWHYKLHQGLHVFKYKKIPNFWRIFFQVLAVLGAVAILF